VIVIKFDFVQIDNYEFILAEIMVITFLLDTDYKRSASLLDQKRLINQRREALQILNNVQRLKGMGQFLGLNLPSDPYQWYSWIRLVIKCYQQESKSQGKQLLRINGVWQFVPNDQPLLSLGTNDLTIKYGYIYHPAVLMWLGYEQSLKDYINAHIDETVRRGFNNQMEKYQVENPEKPPWSHDWDFIARHRAILLKKEVERHEKPWYQLIPNFLSITSIISDTSCISSKYFWAFTPSIGKSAQKQGDADNCKKYQIDHRH